MSCGGCSCVIILILIYIALRYIIVLKNDLFEVMVIGAHCNFVSDLKFLKKQQKENLAAFIESTVAADDFSESEWCDAFGYITGITEQSSSASIRELLVSFLRK